MLWETRSVGDRADRKSSRGSEHVERALVAGSDRGEDDTGLSLETWQSYDVLISFESLESKESPARTFGSTIDERLQTLGVLGIDEVDEGRAHPPARVDRVEPTNDNVELHVVVISLVLDLAEVAA